MRPTGLFRYYDGDALAGKDCTGCGKSLKIDEYHKATDKIDGSVARCRGCCSRKVQSDYGVKYGKDGIQLDGWIETISIDPILKGLDIVPARRYKGWQGARFYQPDGKLAGKICPDCREAKTVRSFSRNSGHPDGLSTYCNLCGYKRNDEYLKSRLEEDHEYRRNASKKSYKKYFSRTEEEIRIDRTNLRPDGLKRCRVCREDLEFSEYYVGKGQPDGRALDCKGCMKTKRRRVCEDYWRVQGIPLKCYIAICDKAYEEIDHVVPTSLDGPDEVTNLLPICATHNRRKHGSLLYLWLLEHHPEAVESTMGDVVKYGVDPWGTYVPSE